MSRIHLAAGFVTVCLVSLCGCVTPSNIKDASTQHAANLINLDKTANAYRAKLAEHFDRLVALQREAYIADKIQDEIHAIGKSQAESLRTVDDRLDGESDAAADDFMKSGQRIQEQLIFWGKNFDLWVKGLPGAGFEEKRKGLKERLVELDREIADIDGKIQNASGEERQRLEAEKRNKVRSRGILRQQDQRSDDDLTYISVACDLDKQRRDLTGQLELLVNQIEVMKAFHAKVDSFLAIDATIDGGKIAQAAAAGSQADVTGLVEIQKVLGGLSP